MILGNSMFSIYLRRTIGFRGIRLGSGVAGRGAGDLEGLYRVVGLVRLKVGLEFRVGLGLS